MTDYFLQGPLCHPDLQEIVLACQPVQKTARLQNFQLSYGPDGLPVLCPSEGAATDGVIVALEPEAVRRLDLFQGLCHAAPVAVIVDTADGPRDVLAYVRIEAVAERTHIPPAPDWTLSHHAILCRATAEIMGLADTHPPEVLQARWSMALSHAASVERGQQEAAPARLRSPWTRTDVELEDHAQPYAWFFGVCEEDLRFRRFDGSLAPRVKRAAFVMSDAVTVLPYDPVRDHVLLIEQFRVGPWLRGVENCWAVEPIAGRVDPFESPQDCALREAREEARLDLREERLLPVGNVYPSPGATTEFLYQFVALCDLPDGIEGVGGLASEAEDIRSHVVPFSKLMELVEDGEVQNGPLVLTAYWLAAKRAHLRAEAGQEATRALRAAAPPGD